MTNPIAPDTNIKIKGVDYTLKFDFEAIATAEELTGRSLLVDFAGVMQKGKMPNITTVRALFFAALYSTHPDVLYEQAKAMVTQHNISAVWIATVGAWVKGLGQPDPDEEPEEGEATAQS